jgi:prepilin signal peptidase PulO-like enzyme (type II secretory pathway)
VGLFILPVAYALTACGALYGQLPALLLGTFAASSACYGFIYLGGLSGVLETSGALSTQASAGYFLMAYLGFSLPVITTGLLIDVVGHAPALALFGAVLLVGVIAVIGFLLKHRIARQANT